MAITTKDEGTLRDKHDKSYVDSPSRGEPYSAQEVVIGNTASEPIPVEVNFDDNVEFDNADGSVSAVKAIYKTINGVAHANNNTTLDEATVIGISITGATTGNKVRYKISGRLEDSSFNFTLNAPLYLDINGNITEIAPATGFRTRVGNALETGAIYILLEEPIEL
jgi:hypothetical protein